MGKKSLLQKLKSSSEVVEFIRVNMEKLKNSGLDQEFINKIETTARELAELSRSLADLKQAIKSKKADLDHKKEIVGEMDDRARKVIKKVLGKKAVADFIKSRKPSKKKKKDGKKKETPKEAK